MLENTEVTKFLIGKGLTLAGPLITDFDEHQRFFAFVEVNTVDGRSTPGPYALSNIADEARTAGWDILFVLVENRNNDVDDTVKTLLFNRFPHLVQNSFASQRGTTVDVWIEPKQHLEVKERSEVEGALGQLIELLGLKPGSISVTRSVDLPTTTAVLRTLRTIAPASRETLKAALQERKLLVPDEAWLNRMMDRLRKAGDVVRRKDGTYILTLKAILMLGSALGRKSPDISRALALAQRKD